MLEPEAGSRGRYIDTAPSGDLRFGANGGYWLDVAAFEDALDALLPRPPEQLGAEELGRLAVAADLYAGDLLAGVYDDWALTERERSSRASRSGPTRSRSPPPPTGGGSSSRAAATRSR